MSGCEREREVRTHRTEEEGQGGAQGDARERKVAEVARIMLDVFVGADEQTVYDTEAGHVRTIWSLCLFQCQSQYNENA